jgi:hypothetical protein
MTATEGIVVLIGHVLFARLLSAVFLTVFLDGISHRILAIAGTAGRPTPQ